jgi:hypothetical protein
MDIAAADWASAPDMPIDSDVGPALEDQRAKQ